MIGELAFFFFVVTGVHWELEVPGDSSRWENKGVFVTDPRSPASATASSFCSVAFGVDREARCCRLSSSASECSLPKSRILVLVRWGVPPAEEELSSLAEETRKEAIAECIWLAVAQSNS